jgi:hypothetical protein
MLKINIRTKPIRKFRTKDVGDYYWIISPVPEENVLKIVIAEMENPDYEFLVALHEFIESYLLIRRKANFEEIEKWENQFLKEKEEGRRPQNAVAGEQKDCPYRKEHTFATKVEKIVAKHLKVNWRQYDKYLDNLLENYVQKSSNSR